jgi:hypothetical protein
MNSTPSDNDPDHVYVDLTIKNIQSTNDEAKPIIFYENRNSAYLNNAGNYNMSITRFMVDTYSLPSYIAEIQSNQSNPNLMIQTVSLRYTNGANVYNTAAIPLIWQPVNLAYPTPSAPNTTPDGMQVDSLYYYSYSIAHLIKLYNIAFTTAMVSLRSLSGGLGSVDPPFIVYDTNTKKISVYCEEAHFNQEDAIHIDIYFNRAAYAQFSSLPAYRYAISSSNGQIYNLRMDPSFGVNIVKVPGSLTPNKDLIMLTQEVSTICNISPISSVVFTTSTLPIVKNILSSPINYLNGELINSNFNNNFGFTITDITTLDDSFKPTLLYNPTAEYRRISLQGNQPLSAIDLQIHFKTKDGNLHPLFLWSGGSCQIKILFEKKIKTVKLLN